MPKRAHGADGEAGAAPRPRPGARNCHCMPHLFCSPSMAHSLLSLVASRWLWVWVWVWVWCRRRWRCSRGRRPARACRPRCALPPSLPLSPNPPPLSLRQPGTHLPAFPPCLLGGGMAGGVRVGAGQGPVRRRQPPPRRAGTLLFLVPLRPCALVCLLSLCPCALVPLCPCALVPLCPSALVPLCPCALAPMSTCVCPLRARRPLTSVARAFLFDPCFRRTSSWPSWGTRRRPRWGSDSCCSPPRSERERLREKHWLPSFTAHAPAPLNTPHLTPSV